MAGELVINPYAAAVIVVVCLALSAFFSASETSLTAASRARMLALEKAGDEKAARVNRLMLMRERLIGTVLIGNNVVNVALSAFMASLLVPIFGSAGVIYATFVISVLIIVFAEVMPKTAAIARPDHFSLMVARPLSWFVALFGPLTMAIEAVVRRLLRLIGYRVEDDAAVLSAHEELRGAVDLLHKEGGVMKSDRDMLGGLLDLKDLLVSDVMIHRTRMRAIDSAQPPDAIVRDVLSSPYTRMPMWRDSPENIVGLLHAKDLLRALDAVGGQPERLDLAGITAPPWFVPDTTTLADQLRAFLQKKTHFAFVVDEYGVVMGLITLEDVLEEIVGDIKDEHDTTVPGVRPQSDGSLIADGGVPIRDLNRAMDWTLPDEKATTIAGLVMHEAGTIPDIGQVFTFHGFRFAIMRKARNRITAMRITPLPKKPPADKAG